jgi:hypothetical protein
LYELFKVAEITRPTKTKASLYKLLGPDGKLIDRWFLRQDLLKIDSKNLMKELETTETFVVEKVLDKEVLGDGKVKYLVKWYGYSDKDNTWESPQESFQAAIDEYEAVHKEEVKEEVPSEQIENIPADTEPAVDAPPKAVKRRGRPPKKATSVQRTIVEKPQKMTLSKQLELAAAQGAALVHQLDVHSTWAKVTTVECAVQVALPLLNHFFSP